MGRHYSDATAHARLSALPEPEVSVASPPLCIYLHVGMHGLGWDEDVETFLGETINTFRYRYMGLPALDGLQYIAGSNLLGVALASMMKIAADAKAKAKADALQKIATSSEPEMRKYLLCECVEAYLPLEEVQMKEYENLLITPAYQGASKYGKTSFELGQLASLQELLQNAQPTVWCFKRRCE